MTSEAELHERNRRIWAIRLNPKYQTGEQRYHAYKDLLPHEVALIEFPQHTELNCFLYLFPQLRENPDLLGLDNWLKARGYVEVSSAKDAEVYVLYIDRNWVHIGKLLDEHTVISKWGWEEPVFRHPLTFQPLQYDTIKFFRKR